MNPPTRQPDFKSLRRNMGATRVGDWVLHPDLGVLRREGEENRLNSKSLHVLLVLIEAGDKGVAREDLLDLVWGEGYPADSVVSRAISDLRSAFGERAGEQKYLRTLPKFGYQLVAPVEGTTAKPGHELRSSARRPAGAWVGLLGIVVVLLIGALWLERRASEEEDLPGIPRLPSPRPVTSSTGLEHQPRIVPGGQWVVYAALRPLHQDWDLFRVAVSDGISQPVAVTPDVHEHGPAVSPSGEELAYVRMIGERCEVVAQSLVLGVPEPLAACTNKFPTLVDWSPGGRVIAFTAAESDDPDGYRRLYQVDRFTGERRSLSTGVSPTGSDFYPRFSPSGKWLAFLRGEPQPDHRSSLWLVDVQSGAERRLTAQPTQLGGMTWIDETTLIYSLADSGRMKSRRLALDTGEDLPFEPFGLLHPDYSSEGDLLVAAQQRSARGLFLIGAEGRGAPVADSTSDDHHGSLSPDEAWVAFISRRSGFEEVWIAEVAGGSARRLTRFDGATVRYPDWHPGGQRIIFSAQTDGGERLFETDLVSGSVRAFGAGTLDATTPRWLPDGERWVYGCLDAQGWGVCVEGEGGVRRIVTGYFRPVPINAGAVAVIDDSGILYSLSLADGKTVKLWDGLPGSGRFGWTLSGNTLVYSSLDEVASGPALIGRDLQTGDSTVLFEGSMPVADTGISIGRGSGAVLFTRNKAYSDDLVLFENALSNAGN